MIETRLIDRRSLKTELPKVLEAMKASSFVGVDCETQDSERHEGLNQFCGYREDGTKPKNKKLVFDMRRMIMTGFSVYPDASNTAWYINLAHADVENRLDWSEVSCILEALPDEGTFLAHNAPFELSAFRHCHGYEFTRGKLVCTLQMLVSAYGPDEYNQMGWHQAGLGGMRALLMDFLRVCRTWVPDETRKNYPKELSDLIGKVTAKESTAAHSYNGFVAELAYGYGLKRAVKTWFNYDMTTFEDVLQGKPHMGFLTGEETCSYGAEDAYWVVPLFHKILGYMAENCPDAIPTFFSQENPMIHVYADIRHDGIRIDLPSVAQRRDAEREEFSALLAEMKAAIRDLLPWRTELDPELAEKEPWYAKNGARYRQMITEWATSPDSADPLEEALKVSSPVSNAWAADLGIPVGKKLNLGHYMPMRVIYYDLMDEKIITQHGKVQSDGDTRGKLIARMERDGRNDGAAKLIGVMGRMASCEQRMKLYLTPYLLLTDPETLRIYPTISSMLATRRMGAEAPNTMQLAKRGEGAYVRGFYLSDDDEDHVILSLDWSGVELVRIGEESGDPEFFKAFGQLPHQDMHSGAAADVLTVEIPEMNEELFKSLRSARSAEDIPFPRLLMDLDGRPIKPEKVYGYWRTEIGKGANFNYWYSGWLTTIGERMGWTSHQTAEATERYAGRFQVAEAWRRGVIEEGAFSGYTTLCDGHRRVRPEARLRFVDEFMQKWPVERDPNLKMVVADMARRIQRRGGNVLVNAKIQGGCAAVAKRSILSIDDWKREAGLDNRVLRFMWPTHDELTFSVRRDLVGEVMPQLRHIMCDHPDLFKTMKLDASASVGRTFEPWNSKTALKGQVELMEPPAEIVGAERANKPLDADGVQEVVDYLFAT
jgi:DNA polymerase I-like protein with 3'-5' exonuclease and polymerase domains